MKLPSVCFHVSTKVSTPRHPRALLDGRWSRSGSMTATRGCQVDVLSMGSTKASCPQIPPVEKVLTSGSDQPLGPAFPDGSLPTALLTRGA